MKQFCILAVFLLIFGAICQSPYGPYADVLLSLSDQALYEVGIKRLVGKCLITRCTTSQCACDLYAKISINSTTTAGLPDLIGSGCVVAPDFPKHMNVCWPAPNTYPTYNSSPTPICTSSGVKNAANMLRIAISRGWCKLPLCLSYPSCPVVVPR